MSRKETGQKPALRLVYNVTPIRDRGDMLSLTDMWRAADKPPHKDPAQWRGHAGTSEFIEYVQTTMVKNHSELFQAVNQRGEWNTWAHWQLGMAYAKYLSPEFHAWCNTVVRDYMEGRLKPVSIGNGATMDDMLVAIREIGEKWVGPLAHKIETTASDVTELRSEMRAGFSELNHKVTVCLAEATKQRGRITKAIKRLHLETLLQRYGGKCPIDETTVIYDGMTFTGHWHHWKGDRAANSKRDFLPVSKANHKLIHDEAIAPEKVEIIAKAFYIRMDDVEAPGQMALPCNLPIERKAMR